MSLTHTGTGKVEEADPLSSSMPLHCLELMVLSARYSVAQLLGLCCEETCPLKMNFFLLDFRDVEVNFYAFGDTFSFLLSKGSNETGNLAPWDYVGLD